MNNTSSKMQWFIDKYNNGKLSYQLKNSGENFGTIVMPTGYGKSSVVYEDIIYAINHAGDKKIVFNISCPILKLTQQFISDLFSIFVGIYGQDVLDTIKFYINSSDNGNNYNDALQQLNMDADKFSHFKKFIESKSAKFAIVASCHKSLSKFINASPKFSTDILIYNYIDEAHLICLHANNEDEDIVSVNVNKMCMHAFKTYAFSATPNADVTGAINAWNTYGNDAKTKYIIHVKPIDAINENVIVAPLVKFINIGENDHIDPSMLGAIMKDAINSNPNITHKILVTLRSSEELNEIRKKLENLGFKVFSTCAAYGFGTKEEAVNGDDIVKFINDIDSYDKHCFVLHIRQLIQGIDIKTLTDCVLLNTTHGNQQHYRHTIQTIGRILRPYAGERGMIKENRKKKVGNTYFLVPDSAEETRANLEQFTMRYYGFDNVLFEQSRYNAPGLTKDDLFEGELNFIKNKTNIYQNICIQELLCNIEKYVDKEIAPKIKFEMQFKNKKDMKSEIKAAAEKTLAKFDKFGIESNTADLLDNRDLLNEILKMFYKFGIQTELF